MLASQIIDNGYHETKNMVGNIPDLPSPHSLVGCVRRYLGVTMGEDKKDIRSSFIGMTGEEEFTEIQIQYALGDVTYLYPLYLKQQEYIKSRALQHVITLENKLTPVLIKIENRGCLIDKERHNKNIESWRVKIKEIEDQLDNVIIDLGKKYPALQGGKYTNPRKTQGFLQLDMFGGEGYVVSNLNLYNINYSSPKQIEDVFTRVGAPKPVDDNGKVSFGENPINTYVTNHPTSPLKQFVETLLEYRKYSKLLSTYGESLLTLLDRDGRLRTSYGQCFTDTARLNSAAVIKGELGTNLANIPAGNIRNIFIPDPGYSFVDVDMAGQEILIAGEFSKEPMIIKSFNEGLDLHSYLSSISYSIIFDKPFQVRNEKIEVQVGDYTYNLKKLRDDHKSCLFAKFYGGGARRVQNVLNEYLVKHWPAHKRFEKAEEISRALDAALPVLTKYLRLQVDFCKRHGYVVSNKLGRRRYFDNPGGAYGEIMNYSGMIGVVKSDKLLEAV